MRAIILDSPIGFLAFNEDNQLIEKVLFEKNSETVAEKIFKVENGEIVEELELLLKKLLAQGYDSFVFERLETTKNIRKTFNAKVETTAPSNLVKLLRENLPQFSIDCGFTKTEQELQEWLYEVSVVLTKKRVQKAAEKRDLMVAQAVLSIDDLDKTINLFMSRIIEWYGLHFPELTHSLNNQETYARLIFKLGKRENFVVENLEKELLSKDKAEQIANIAATSMGATLSEEDIQQIQEMCKTTLELFKLRRSLEKYVDETMSDVAPNMQALAGSLLGARLIAIAGGLDNLAKMPASTIQVLGAEKALFRALKTGTRPPKHGLLFQHTLVHDAVKWQRGKISRVLAGKLAIAARMDAYGGKYVGEELKADLERRIKEIQEKYKEPPTPSKLKKAKQKKEAERRFKRGHRG